MRVPGGPRRGSGPAAATPEAAAPEAVTPEAVTPGHGGFGSTRHLLGRLAGSLWPAGPGRTDEAWARHWLREGERQLWERMSGPDRRHAVGVARRTAGRLGRPDGAKVPKAVLAAALLHDAGKVTAGLGTFGRVAATMVTMAVGRPAVAAWSARPDGWRRRLGLYVCHDALGADLLELAGSDSLVVTWAREHHLRADRWSLDARIGAALKAADDD